METKRVNNNKNSTKNRYIHTNTQSMWLGQHAFRTHKHTHIESFECAKLCCLQFPFYWLIMLLAFHVPDVYSVLIFIFSLLHNVISNYNHRISRFTHTLIQYSARLNLGFRAFGERAFVLRIYTRIQFYDEQVWVRQIERIHRRVIVQTYQVL